MSAAADDRSEVPPPPVALLAAQQAWWAALQSGGQAQVPGLAGLPGPRGQGGLAAGWRAYRANAMATAARALQAAYPTVAALVGEEAWQAVARDLWWQQPPRQGDLAQWGAGLPALLAGVAEWQSLPYLADVARLDWRVHQAGLAADATAPVQGLDLLAATDPMDLVVDWQPGCAWLASPHPVVTLWQAHRPPPATAPVPPGEEPPPWASLAEAALAVQAARAEAALVWREGWGVRVTALPPLVSHWTQALWFGASLGQVLAGPPPARFSQQDVQQAFEPWLLQALRSGWLRAWRQADAGHPLSSTAAAPAAAPHFVPGGHP